MDEKQARELGNYFQKLRQEDPQKLTEVLQELSSKEIEAVTYDPIIWATDTQYEVLKSDTTVTAMIAGRGAGKTACMSFKVKNLIEQGVKQIALIGPTAADVRDTMVLGPSGIIAAFPPDEQPIYEPSKRRVYWEKHNAQAIMYSADSGDQIRGANNEFIAMDEVGSWPDKDVFDQAMLTLRRGISQCLITTTPRNNETIRYLYAHRITEDNPDGFVNWVQGTTYENLHNLSKAFKNQIMTTYEGTRLGQQELEGLLLLDAEGALWSTDTVVECQVAEHDMPNPAQVSVGIDPAVSTKKKSDLTGIIVSMMGEDGLAYVLGDYTGRYSPEGWARKVVELYNQYADTCPVTVTVERNNGGSMCKDTLYRYNRMLPINDVFSSQDKLSRAQPIALLYEQGKVKHAPGLTDLENEMTGYDGKGKSPDRLDAAVFSLMELMPVRRRVVTTRELMV